jgi:hypothetical protein
MIDTFHGHDTRYLSNLWRHAAAATGIMRNCRLPIGQEFRNAA